MDVEEFCAAVWPRLARSLASFTGDRALGEGRIRLRRGEYVLYCAIPGHRAAGMEADLVVE